MTTTRNALGMPISQAITPQDCDLPAASPRKSKGSSNNSRRTKQRTKLPKGVMYISSKQVLRRLCFGLSYTLQYKSTPTDPQIVALQRVCGVCNIGSSLGIIPVTGPQRIVSHPKCLLKASLQSLKKCEWTIQAMCLACASIVSDHGADKDSSLARKRRCDATYQNSARG
jgi:hypothetical protein